MGDASAHQDDVELAQMFAEVARALGAEDSVERTLTRICELGVQTIEGCDHAGVALVEGRKITTTAASDEIPARVDAIQYETDEGPCLDAMREHEIFVVDELAAEARWPKFASRAAQETGIASILSFRLFVDEDTLGSLNLYSTRNAAFRDDEPRELGAVFAAHAAVALSSAQREAHLEEAVRSRDVIGQAKGILMARKHVTEEQAFAILRRASQRLNVKLREIAERVAQTGEDPEDPQ